MNELELAIWNYIKVVDELSSTPYPTISWTKEDTNA